MCVVIGGDTKTALIFRYERRGDNCLPVMFIALIVEVKVVESDNLGIGVGKGEGGGGGGGEG